MNQKFTYLFLFLALITGLEALSVSGALSEVFLERQVSATVVENEALGLVKLDSSGPDNPFKANKNPRQFGSVTNNFSQTVTVTLTLEPDFSQMAMNRLNPRFEFAVTAGDSTQSYRVWEMMFPRAKSLVFELTPGESQALEVALDSIGEETMQVSFTLAFESEDGSVDLTLYDTAQEPLRLYLE